MKITFKQILIWLVIAFIILFIWDDPAGASSAIGDFLGATGSFFGDLIDKFSTFLSGLTDEG